MRRSLFTVLALLSIANAASPGLAAGPVYRAKPVSFRDDVAPILVRKCLGCHNTQKAANGLDISTFARLKKGGKLVGADILEAGEPEASGLLESVSATASPRMPYKLPPLSDAEIATLTRWIKEGAKFDGPSEKDTPIVSLVDPLRDLPKVTSRIAVADPASAVAFSPDGKLLAASGGRTVVVYDLATGKPKATWPDHPGPISTLRFAAAGKLLIAVGGRPSQFGSITAWDLDKGTKRFEIREPGDAFLGADISPDGKTLATSSYNRRILLWDPEKGTRSGELKDHTDSVYAVAFSPDGKWLASCGADRTVKVWDWRKGVKLVTLSDATAELYDVVFSPDGKRILASGVDKSIRIWSAADREFPLIRSVFAHGAAVIRLAVSRHGSLLATCAEDRTLKLWNLDSMDAKLVLSGQSDWVEGLAFSPDARRLAVGRFDGSVALLDPSGGKTTQTLREPPKAEASPPTLARNPSLDPPSPRGGVRGSKVRVTLTGEGVDKATSILTPGGLSATIVPNPKSTPNRLEIDLTIAADAPAGIRRFTTNGPAGVPADQPFDVSPFPEVAEAEPNDQPAKAPKLSLPATITGAISQPGDTDHFAFGAKAGEHLVFEVVTKSLGSMHLPLLTILDTAGKTLASTGPAEGGADPTLLFKAPGDGTYVLEVADADYGGSAAHFYRIRAGKTPRVESVFPRGLARGETANFGVVGVNLDGQGESSLTAPADATPGTIVAVPVNAGGTVSSRSRDVVVAEGKQSVEVEPNDGRDQAQELPPVGGVSGRIGREGDVDLYRFKARKGERRIIEVFGRRLGTPIDSVVDILDREGRPVPRAVLRPVDKTEVAFRDHGSANTGIRLTKWNNLEVNDLVLVGREVMRIFALPRNPDDDCQFAGEQGQRLGMLETTPEHHPMSQPIYKVEVHPPGTKFPSGGTAPVTLNYHNDDGGGPRLGKDSRITFDPPSDGEYLIRIQDVRQAGGPDFAYHLVVRPPAPDYQISAASNLNIPRGGTRILMVTLTRIDGFDQAVDVWAEGLPPGIKSTGTRILPGELTGQISFTAEESAPGVSPPGWKLASRVVGSGSGPDQSASAEHRVLSMGGEMGGRITVTREPNLKVRAEPSRLVIQPGQEVTMKVSVVRNSGFKGRVPVLVQNLPQGVRVLNVGLNGVLITETQTERTVVVRAEPWVKPLTRPFYAVGKAESAGTEDSSSPITLEVTASPARLSRSR